MQIIKGIKIRNFRSFTGIKSEVYDLKDFNIFSGSNDSGKSNIFRALNLFFNNEVTHGIQFDMERDFSEQKKSGTHRVVEIRLDFELTTSGTTYLSKKFSIEKKYYRGNWYDYTFIYIENDGNELKISSDPDKNKGIENEEKYRKQFNEFLGKIKFEYVPAIREPRYFSYLFGRVISKVREAEKERIQRIEDFIQELEDPKNSIKRKKSLIKIRNDKINGDRKKKGKGEYSEDYKDDLKKEIQSLEEEIVNLESEEYVRIKLTEQKSYKERVSELQRAIENLSTKINSLSGDLFKNISFIENAEFTIADNLLDFFETFEIGTGINKTISLKSRGDGMQSKFIPIILDFLSKVQRENEKGKFEWEYERNKYFLWGFEEPENSYEYSNSIRLANNFVGLRNRVKNEDGEYLKDGDGKYILEDINFSERKQIFITTHSEEFLRLFSEEKVKSKISLYLIEKQIKDKSSSIRHIGDKDLEDVHSNLGLANIARSKLKFDIGQKIYENDNLKNKLQDIIDELNSIEKSKKNILYVEDHYTSIYKVAYLKLNNIHFNKDNLDIVFEKNASFDIFGARGRQPLYQKLNAPCLDEFNSKKVIGLFDYDEAYNDFNGLPNTNGWSDIQGNDYEGKYKTRQTNILTMLLPVPVRLYGQANESLKSNSLLEVELYLSENSDLQSVFGEQTERGGGTSKVFKGNKKNFWEKLVDFDKDDFNDFIPLFKTINDFFNT